MNFRMCIALFSVILCLFIPSFVFAYDTVSIIVTSNLRGNFSLVPNDENDPMLKVARGIAAQRQSRPVDCYIDLGNAFAPGVLSRYSYGAAMFDFFEYLQCDAVLVGSHDISIGLRNLELASRNRAVHLLSINITVDNRPIFKPYWIFRKAGTAIGFIGITSSKGIFDVAEKRALSASLTEYKDYLNTIIETLQEATCKYIIVLSGLSASENTALMKEYPAIDLILAGGDASGMYYNLYAPRVDLDDGRSIVTLVKGNGHYTVRLGLKENIAVEAISFSDADKKITDDAYRDLEDRLNVWRERFAHVGAHVITDSFPVTDITSTTIAHILRHYYYSEAAIIDARDTLSMRVSGSISTVDVQQIVQNDFLVFTYRLSGKQLIAASRNPSLIFSGLSDGRIQGASVHPERMYRISSTQSAFDVITGMLNEEIAHTNTWTPLSTVIINDLTGSRHIAREDFSYLDDRLRMIVDISLSNIYDKSEITTEDIRSRPPGMPAASYRRWGIENSADISIYNQNHRLTLTPYIYYMRQDELYLQNLLRGTLFYSYIFNPYLNPYHKSQIDTIVVEKEDGLRPILIRETIGASLLYNYISGRVGIGFEKQIQDPEKHMLYGAESLVQVRIPFMNYFTYIFSVDTFVTIPDGRSNEYQMRAEIRNTLNIRLNNWLSFSVRYRWFYYNPLDLQIPYKYTQLLFTLDVNTRFKVF